MHIFSEIHADFRVNHKKYAQIHSILASYALKGAPYVHIFNDSFKFTHSYVHIFTIFPKSMH